MTVEAIVMDAAGRVRRQSDLPAATDRIVFYQGRAQPLSVAGVVIGVTDPFVVDDTAPPRVRRYSRTDEASAPPPPPPPPPPTNLIINGDASDGTNHWTGPRTDYYGSDGTIASVGGKLRVTSGAVGYVIFTQAIATTIGATYRVTADIQTAGCSYWGIRKMDLDFTNSVDLAINTNGTALNNTFTATNISTLIYIQSNGGYTDFDNITALREP